MTFTQNWDSHVLCKLRLQQSLSASIGISQHFSTLQMLYKNCWFTRFVSLQKLYPPQICIIDLHWGQNNLDMVNFKRFYHTDHNFTKLILMLDFQIKSKYQNSGQSFTSGIAYNAIFFLHNFKVINISGVILRCRAWYSQMRRTKSMKWFYNCEWKFFLQVFILFSLEC